MIFDSTPHKNRGGIFEFLCFVPGEWHARHREEKNQNIVGGYKYGVAIQECILLMILCIANLYLTNWIIKIDSLRLLLYLF